MGPSRIVGLATAAALLLTACTADEEPPAAATSTAPTTSASPTSSDPVVAWAGEVCSGADAVADALVGLAAALPADPSSGQPVDDQVRAELRARVDAVEQEVASLTDAVEALPPEADAGVAQAKEGLVTPARQARTAVDAVATEAEQVAAATTPEAVQDERSDLEGALVSATAAVGTYASEVRKAISSTNEAVRSSFSAAPSCQQIPTP
jgi:hypothetical protein